MSYIGNPIVSTDFPVDYASGNGSTTAFTLSVAPASVNAIDVQISGVSQSPQTYSVSGTTLTFSAAPPSGTNNIVVRHLGVAGIPNTPSAGSVVTTSIANNAVTPAKMANGGAEFSFRNRIINGAMVINQRAFSGAIGDQTYTLDRWICDRTGGSATATVSQSSTAPAGYINSLLYTVGTGASPAATDYSNIRQYIEGLNCTDLAWGTADAKTVTLSFWVRSSVTGTYGIAISNSAYNRNYIGSYTISSANTWTQAFVTIPGDTSGTWLTTNGVGIRVLFDLGVGSTYSASAGSWTSSVVFGLTGGVKLAATAGATFYVTGVQLEVGSSATGFEYRQYQQELALCYRYYRRYLNGGSAYTAIGSGLNVLATNLNRIGWPLDIPMRSAPTLNFVNCVSWNGGVGGAVTPNVNYSSTNTIDVDMLTSGLSGSGNGVAAKVLMLSNGYIEVGAEL